MSKQIDVLDELEQIAKNNDNILRAADVVEFAKDPETALYSRFEWDNEKAGYQWRLQQARQVIRISVNFLPEIETDEPIRVFVSQSEDRCRDTGGGYRYFLDVMSEEESRAKFLKQARDDFKIWQKKYQALKELEPVFAAMDELSTIKAIVAVKPKQKRKQVTQPHAIVA